MILIKILSRAMSRWAQARARMRRAGTMSTSLVFLTTQLLSLFLIFFLILNDTNSLVTSEQFVSRYNSSSSGAIQTHSQMLNQ